MRQEDSSFRISALNLSEGYLDLGQVGSTRHIKQIFITQRMLCNTVTKVNTVAWKKGHKYCTELLELY